MGRAREVLFRIFYSTTFTITVAILFIFCCVTPADKIYASYRRDRLIDIFIITGAYVLTGLIALFLYASRLYSNRSVLRDIPKTFLPIEKEDLPGKRVYKLIEECLARSAVVAYHAKPRAKRIEVELPHAGERLLILTNRAKPHRHEHHLTEHEQRLLDPKWGSINHPGWHSPAAKELPNLEYAKVVDELVDLIEAKAVSLVPVDTLAALNEDGTGMPDERAIELLTRPDNMGMRHYLTILAEVGVVPDDQLSEDFLLSYERARFSPRPLSEPEFQTLMRLFAELLRSLTQIASHLVDLDDDHPRPLPRTPSDKASTFSAPSALHAHTNDLPPPRISEDSAPSISEDELEVQTYLTSKTSTRTPENRSTSRPPLNARFFSADSRPNLRQTRSQASIRSSRSAKSARSARSARSMRSNGSVIRLASAEDRHDLPYTIEVPQGGTA